MDNQQTAVAKIVGSSPAYAILQLDLRYPRTSIAAVIRDNPAADAIMLVEGSLTPPGFDTAWFPIAGMSGLTQSTSVTVDDAISAVRLTLSSASNAAASAELQSAQGV